MATIMTDLALRLFANTSELKKGLNEASGAAKKMKSDAATTGKGVSGAFSNMAKESKGALGAISSSFSSIGPAASGALGGMKSLAGGAALLNVALGPIGLIIGAIALAVKALSAYFTGSVDGAEKFAKIMGYIQGLLSFLQDIFISLGRAMVDAFENPKEAIASLWEAIKQNLINRFQGLIDIFTAGFSLIKNGFMGVALAIKGLFDDDAKKKSQEYFKAMGEDLKNVGKAMVQTATGLTPDDIKAIGDAASAALKKANEVAKNRAKIEADAFALQMKQIANSKTIADMETKISNLKLISADKEAYSNEERLAANEEAQRIIEEKGAIEIANAKEALRLQVERNKNSESGVADLKAEADLYIASEAAIKKQQDELREVVTQHKEINASIVAEKKAIEDKAKADAAALATKKTEATNTAKAIVAEYAKDKNEASLAGRIQNINNAFNEELSKLEELHNNELLAEADYLAAKKALNMQAIDEVAAAEAAALEATNQKRLDAAYLTGDALMSITDTISQFQQAAYNKEIAAAGNNEKKKEEITKRFAKKQQKISIANALINGALGVTRAFADLGPIAGAIFAGLVTAQTAAQISVISSQQFAKGGIVYGPTNALVGEYPGANRNPEVIAPLDKLQNILSSTSGFAMGDVKFKIEGRDLVGIYNKESKISSLY